jgi:hypothetical protein
VAEWPTDPVRLQPRGWHGVTPPQCRPSVALNYRGRIWLIDTSDTNAVFCSKDGLSWEWVTGNLPFGRREFCAGAVFDDGHGEKMWVMGGVSMSLKEWTLLNDVWHSEDGVTWTQAQTSDIWPGRFGHACVAFKGKLWVLGGNVFRSINPYVPNWPARPDKVWSSPDGIRWTQEDAPWCPRTFFGATVFKPASPANVDQLWLCGGSDGTFPPTGSSVMSDAWYTNDGVTWTQAKTPNWPPRVSLNRLQQLDNRLWLLGGYPNILSQTGLTDMWVMDADMNWSSVGDVPAGYGFSAETAPIAYAFDWRLWLLLGREHQHYYNP